MRRSVSPDNPIIPRCPEKVKGQSAPKRREGLLRGCVLPVLRHAETARRNASASAGVFITEGETRTVPDGAVPRL